MMARVKPVLVLSVIGLVAALLLALTNAVTVPLVKEAEARKEQEALLAVLPNAEGFERLELPENAPKTVVAVYRDTAKSGYVFRMETAGFAAGLKLVCGIDESGRVTGLATLATSETDGYGKKCTEDAYASQYIGEGASLDGVDAVSGATKTSRAYENAVKDAFKVFEILTEGGNG